MGDKISVIVPVYNVENYLERCLDSIVNQTHKNLEILLMDDGSTDSSGDICERYSKKDSRIRVFHQQNKGQSAARNKALEIATGDFISFVDSDDWLAEDIYGHVMNTFQKTDGVDIVDFNMVFSTEKSIPQYEEGNTVKIYQDSDILFHYLERGQTGKAPFVVWRKVFRRQVLETIRFPEGQINEDIVFNYHALKKASKLAVSDKVGYIYNQEGTSTTKDGLKQRDFDLLDVSKELYESTLEDGEDRLIKLAKVKLGRSYFSLLAKIAFYGIQDSTIDKKETIKTLTKQLRSYYPTLMSSPIPVNRKAMITLTAVDIRLLSTPLKIYKAIKK